MLSRSSVLELLFRATRFALPAVILLGLAGCVDAERPNVSAETVTSFKLTSVSVDFAPNAAIHISPVEDQVHARGVYDREQVAAAEKAQIRQVFAEVFSAVVGARLTGARPVAARIVVTGFNVPGPLMTALASGSYSVAAGVDLVDAATGATLVSVPPGKISNAVYQPGGVGGLIVQAVQSGDPSDRKTRQLAQIFSNEYVQWLLGK